MRNGRFIVPQEPSDIAYTITGGGVIKGYVISEDNRFSMDGNVFYTINSVNVVKETNQAKLTGRDPYTLVAGARSYTLANSLASLCGPTGIDYNAATKQFTVCYNGVNVTYTVLSLKTVKDDRRPVITLNSSIVSGIQLKFKDTLSYVKFTFYHSVNNPV